MNITGTVALVAGGTSGLGLATVHALSDIADRHSAMSRSVNKTAPIAINTTPERRLTQSDAVGRERSTSRAPVPTPE
jgi:NAD(P)-dependent dehydrogenase (short-subunit alcohol dehydrogenase family)